MNGFFNHKAIYYSFIEVPQELVPKIRELIAFYQSAGNKLDRAS